MKRYIHPYTTVMSVVTERPFAVSQHDEQGDGEQLAKPSDYEWNTEGTPESGTSEPFDIWEDE